MLRKTVILSIVCLFAAFVPAFAQTTPEPKAPAATAKTAQQYFEEAYKAFQKNDLEAVIFNCRMALSMKADFVDAHYMLGKAYLFKAAKANRLPIKGWGVDSPETRYLAQYVKGRAELKNAINHFKAALTYNPDDIDAMLNLAISQDNYGLEKDAIKSYEKVIEMDKVSTHARDAYNNLGLLYSSQKDFKNAEKCYKKALAIDPNFVPTKINLERLKLAKDKAKNR